MNDRRHTAVSENGPWDYRTVILCILLFLLPLVVRFSSIPPLAHLIGIKVQPLEISFVVLLPLYLVFAARRGKLRFTPPTGWLVFLGFVVVCLVSSLLSVKPAKSLVDTIGFFYLLVLYFFFYALLGKRSAVMVSIRIFLVVSTLVAFIGLLAYWAYMIFGYQTFAVEVVNDFFGVKAVRVNSTFFTCNHLVIYLGFALAIALSFFGSREKRIFKILSVCLIIMTCSFILTGLYRGAFMIWGVLFFGTRDLKKTRWIRVLRGGFLGLTILFLSLFVFQGYMDVAPIEVAHDRAAERLGVSISTRPSIYAELHKTAAEIATEHPVLGVGPGLYNVYMVMPKYGFDFISYPFYGLDPHSTYLGYGAETGALGVLFLVVFFVVIHRRAGVAANAGDYVGRRLGALFRIYFSFLLVYALFIDIVTIRFLYFAYALISALADQTGTTAENGAPEVG